MLVPGLHWDGLVAVGHDGAPTLAPWSGGARVASMPPRSARSIRLLLTRCAAAWGTTVRHLWDRGYAGSPWVQAAIAARVSFVVRWKKGNKLLDNWGKERKAWEIARGKRSLSYRLLRDTRSKS